MARRSNKLIWLIGIPVIAFGLAKGGMHWYVKQKLDQAIMEAAPRFTIEYSRLETSLEGHINISDISIVPVGQSDAFRISTVAIQGPDVITYLLNHNPVTGDKGPPEFLNVAVNNLNLDLTSSMAANLDQSYQLSLQRHSGAAAAVCKVPGNVSFSMLREMGEKTLAGDARFFYRYNEDAQKLRGNVELNIRDIQSLSMEMALANVLPQSVKSGSPGIPSLADFRITLNIPPFFGKKMSLYCSDQTGQTVGEYEEQAAGRFMQSLADNGIVLGRGMQMAVRSYYTNWGEIEIVAKPVQPVNLLGFMFKPPRNIEETLGLQMAINDRLLTDLDFKLQKGARLFVAEPQKEKKPKPPKPRYKKIWKKASPANLHQYLDRKVKLYVTNQPVRKGLLMEVSRNSVAVEQRVDGGKFTAHVPLRNITRAEVNVRVRTNPPPSTPEEGKAEKAEAQQTEAPAQQG